jgi:hypothetical protein
MAQRWRNIELYGSSFRTRTVLCGPGCRDSPSTCHYWDCQWLCAVAGDPFMSDSLWRYMSAIENHGTQDNEPSISCKTRKSHKHGRERGGERYVLCPALQTKMLTILKGSTQTNLHHNGSSGLSRKTRKSYEHGREWGEERKWEREREWRQKRGGVRERAQKGMPLQQNLVQFDNGMEWNLCFRSN